MSHFTVLVTAKNKQDLETRLLPYHEYECTGIEAYIQFVPGDIQEMQRDWECNKTEYENFDAFAKDYYGYKKNDEGVYGHWTNPNAKWDWWQIGGRWTGLLRLKSNRLLVAGSRNGNPGLMTPINVNHKYADFAPANEIDWEGIETDWRRKEREWWGKHQVYLSLAKSTDHYPNDVHEKAGKLWQEETPRGELARKTFGGLQTALEYEYANYLAMKDNEHWFHDWDQIAKILMPQEQFERTLEKTHAMTYAFIDLEGKWQQRGEMGWFGCDDESKGTPDYDLAWWDFVRSIPDELIVYSVDCHI